jgi:hypothetical protein
MAAGPMNGPQQHGRRELLGSNDQVMNGHQLDV